MKSLLTIFLLLSVLNAPAEAHRSGCHRWHSCPSDRGTYVCGDLGYTSGCPQKESTTSKVLPPPSKKEFSKKSELSDFSGKVVAITDGDTIHVMHKGKAVKVRLAEIDCPEKKQAYGTAAKRFTRNLVAGKVVTVEVETIDRYGRTVGRVILQDGRSLNRELIKAGLAWWYRKYSKDVTLWDLEDEAKDQRVGLWNDKDPIPPWKFRRRG